MGYPQSGGAYAAQKPTPADVYGHIDAYILCVCVCVCVCVCIHTHSHLYIDKYIHIYIYILYIYIISRLYVFKHTNICMSKIAVTFVPNVLLGLLLLSSLLLIHHI